MFIVDSWGNNVQNGSKPVIRNQRDFTLEKDCKVFFPSKIFYMQMNFWMNFFVTCCKKY
jgi:hypothetical protein